MSEAKYVVNVKKSKRDKRDYIYRPRHADNPARPVEIDYRSELQPVRDQGRQGTCYAQTVACVKEWQEKKEDNGFDEYMSPQFFYNNRPNKYDDNPENDDGMYGRDVMKLMKEVGICRETVYRYGRVETKDMIPREIYTLAEKHLIKSYARVTTLIDLKESLVRNGPCLITFPTYDNSPTFWRKRGWWKKRQGGHAVAVVGYTSARYNPDQCGFIIRNSWGTDWGNGGYTIYPYSDWGAHWEIWTTIDALGAKDDVYVPSPPSKLTVCDKLFQIFCPHKKKDDTSNCFPQSDT